MSELNYQSAPSLPSPTWVRQIVDYNPCFLLSALCMLFGCRLLNDAVNTKSGGVRGALWLILTINVYEFCLLAVAMLIRRWQGMRRDVGILLLVGALFMGDIAFVVGDLATTQAGLGLVVSVMLTGFAGIKVWLAMGLIGIADRRRVAAVIVGQVAVLLLMPVVFKSLVFNKNGNLSPAVIYAGWWVAGAIPIVARLILRPSTVRRLPTLAKLYVVIPWIAMIGHLLACTWVFKLDFYAACYAPVLLGVSVAVGLSTQELGYARAATWQFGLPLFAIIFTLGDSAITGKDPSHYGEMSPFRLTLLCGAIIHLHGFVVHRQPRFLVSMAMMLGVTTSGPSLSFSKRTVTSVARGSGDTLDNLLPRTAVGWGVVTIVMSFLLLAAGTIVSFVLKPKRADEVSG